VGMGRPRTETVWEREGGVDLLGSGEMELERREMVSGGGTSLRGSQVTYTMSSARCSRVPAAAAGQANVGCCQVATALVPQDIALN